jgi:hypothetical protein
VDRDDAATCLHVTFQGGFFLGVPRIAGGLEHDERVEVREVGVVEDRGVLGVLRGDARVREGLGEHGHALLDRLRVAELGGLGEDQDVGVAVLARMRDGRRRAEHGDGHGARDGGSHGSA